MKIQKRQWIAILLREKDWGSPVVDLENALRAVLSADAAVWFPSVNESTATHDPVGPWAPYVFITPPAPPGLRRVKCVETVLREPMDERELRASVSRPIPIRAGDRVRVTRGPYAKVEGMATRVRRETLGVIIELESGDRTLDVERANVELL